MQVPFSVAFPPPEGSLMDYLVLVVDFIFFVDIFVVLSTPILIHGDECTSRKGIARNYAKLHLWIDLVACIPFSRCGLLLHSVLHFQLVCMNPPPRLLPRR